MSENKNMDLPLIEVKNLKEYFNITPAYLRPHP